MKRFGESIFLALVIVTIGFVVSAVRDQVYAQNPLHGIVQPPVAVTVKQPLEAGRWIVDFVPLVDPTNPARRLQAITVVDPESKRICVYHADLVEGTVKLCSVRNIRGDLQIDQFNPEGLTPVQVGEELKRFRKQSLLEERAL